MFKKNIITLLIIVLSFGITNGQDFNVSIRGGVLKGSPELSSFTNNITSNGILAVLLAEDGLFFEEKQNNLIFRDLPSYTPKTGYVVGVAFSFTDYEFLVDYKHNSSKFHIRKVIEKQGYLNWMENYNINSFSVAVKRYFSSDDLSPFVSVGAGVYNVTNNTDMTLLREYSWKHFMEYKPKFEKTLPSIDFGFGVSYKLYERFILNAEAVYSLSSPVKVKIPGRLDSYSNYESQFEYSDSHFIDRNLNLNIQGLRLNLVMQIQL